MTSAPNSCSAFRKEIRESARTAGGENAEKQPQTREGAKRERRFEGTCRRKDQLVL